MHSVTSMLDRLIEFTTTVAQNNHARRTIAFDVFSDLLSIVFAGKPDDNGKVLRCFKLHVQIEPEQSKQKKLTEIKNGWISSSSTTAIRRPKILNYWCFNPGYGMEELLNKNVWSIILTSGTLAPLKPLIAELAIPISHRLENPHIVDHSQVCVKVVSVGPDNEPLISNFQNRNNPKYVSSLGRTILSLAPTVPDGLLVFFPSYPLMNSCMDSWQASGIWSQIASRKPIFVEPRGKDAFNTTMTEYYEKINDPSGKGAIFMAVCRGKVSEGLDFADKNGRAVIITGLPFPPLKDPRVILKKKYLDDNRTAENELLAGNAWYSLEATRAVNQAIGRVIRHRYDYGAILLCDNRFNSAGQKNQLSAWIQGHLKAPQHTKFGPIIGELSRFFRNADKNIPKRSQRKVDELEPSTSSNSEPHVKLEKVESFDETKKYSEDENAKMKYKSAQAQAMKVENSNSITSWTPEAYKFASNRPKLKAAPAPVDFMSRLEGNVNTIDFNECSKIKTEMSSFKRERASPSKFCDSSVSSLAASKRKKFKLAHVSIGGGSSETPIPEDRGKLLELLKNSLNPLQYKKFIDALKAYQSSMNVDGLLESLKSVFSESRHHYLFKGMRRFVKDHHKDKFDDYISKIG